MLNLFLLRQCFPKMPSMRQGITVNIYDSRKLYQVFHPLIVGKYTSATADEKTLKSQEVFCHLP